MTMKDPEGQTIEYTQYMPGSRHFEDRGKHLDGKRVAQTMMGGARGGAGCGCRTDFLCMILGDPQKVLDLLHDDRRLNRHGSRREGGRRGKQRRRGRMLAVGGFAVAGIGLASVSASKLKRAFFAATVFLLEVVSDLPMLGPFIRLILFLDILF